MLPRANLDCGISRFRSNGARWECHFSIDGERWQGHLAETLRGELGFVDDDLLDMRMGWLGPMRLEGSH